MLKKIQLPASVYKHIFQIFYTSEHQFGSVRENKLQEDHSLNNKESSVDGSSRYRMDLVQIKIHSQEIYDFNL